MPEFRLSLNRRLDEDHPGIAIRILRSASLQPDEEGIGEFVNQTRVDHHVIRPAFVEQLKPVRVKALPVSVQFSSGRKPPVGKNLYRKLVIRIGVVKITGKPAGFGQIDQFTATVSQRAVVVGVALHALIEAPGVILAAPRQILHTQFVFDRDNELSPGAKHFSNQVEDSPLRL